MALTKDQWFAKLRSWVPNWYFEQEGNQVAEFKGLAQVMSEAQQLVEDFRDETFIMRADGPYLDMHGAERSVDRLPLELDSTYAPRIQTIVNSANYPAIKALVDALLVRGESTIVEHYNGSTFLGRGTYLNRAAIFSDIMYNVFSIVVPRQVRPAMQYFGIDCYLDGDAYLGSDESSLELFKKIVETVNNAKAFGVLYRLVETIE